jgi:hypothetical protein
LVPGIETMSSPWCRSHASASGSSPLVDYK